jgi:hypothetical protein
MAPPPEPVAPPPPPHRRRSNMGTPLTPPQLALLKPLIRSLDVEQTLGSGDVFASTLERINHRMRNARLPANYTAAQLRRALKRRVRVERERALAAAARSSLPPKGVDPDTPRGDESDLPLEWCALIPSCGKELTDEVIRMLPLLIE